jgi:drug/metabolite transporter (DMT)-like permease
VIGFIALDQTPTWAQLAGIALVLAGVVTQERDSAEMEATAAELPS